MVGMIANIINTYDWDFILPVTLVDENMKRAHMRDGVKRVKFWWKIPEVDQKITRQSDIENTAFLVSNINHDTK